jgi:hypothetical protein
MTICEISPLSHYTDQGNIEYLHDEVIEAINTLAVLIRDVRNLNEALENDDIYFNHDDVGGDIEDWVRIKDDIELRLQELEDYID